MNKIILTDADGVLLNWEYAFRIWMAQSNINPVVADRGLYFKMADQYDIAQENINELIRQFNKSASIGFLPPFRDSMYYVQRLYESYGYKLHIVTSVGTDPSVVKLRQMNLEKLFGASTLDHVECLPTGASKLEYLSQFKNSNMYWLEDKVDNAIDGKKLGLNSLLMEHGHNMNNTDIPLVKNWKDIYNIICNDVVDGFSTPLLEVHNEH